MSRPSDPSGAAPAVARFAGWRFSRLEQPDGHHIRIARWTAAPDGQPRGTVLLLTGRNETLEKYEEQAADWTARGFLTVGMDWRGQGGSSRYLDNRHKGHVPDFAIFLDDLDRAVAELLPPGVPGPVIAFGHSMGGHILLRYAAERRHPFSAVILSAPMIGIHTGPTPEVLLRRFAARMVKRGEAEKYVLGQEDWSPAEPAFRGNPLTSDPVRFLVGHNHYAADPDLAMGGITWGWLDAAYRSIDRLLAPGGVEGVAVPVLLLTGGKDRVVRVDRQRQVAKRLKSCRHAVHPAARHELMMEADPIRDAVWADIDGFLADLAPAAGQPGS